MYKNILIITDNINIASRFENEVLSRLDDKTVNIKFGCSPFSEISSFKLKHFKIKEVDLRNEISIENIINNYDLVFSIHCKQLFPKNLINKVKCINIHPGYNPINRGWYPQVFAIINDLDIGATIHEIDEEIDHGNIIVREKVNKFEDDTSLSLYNRVVDKEIKLLKENFEKILKNQYSSFKPEKEGRLYLKKDFNDLCELDLNERITMGDAIKKLRALTHGDYKNAYYLDEFGNDIYISVNISKTN